MHTETAEAEVTPYYDRPRRLNLLTNARPPSEIKSRTRVNGGQFFVVGKGDRHLAGSAGKRQIKAASVVGVVLILTRPPDQFIQDALDLGRVQVSPAGLEQIGHGVIQSCE